MKQGAMIIRSICWMLLLSIVTFSSTQAQALRASLTVRAAQSGSVIDPGIYGQILTAASMDAINTVDEPDIVRPAAFKASRARGEQVQFEPPARSLLVLSQS